MRISDWSSDVCSSDLHVHRRRARPRRNLRTLTGMEPRLIRPPFVLLEDLEGGTATLLERPSEALVATTAAEVTSAIGRADQLIEAGRTMAGWIGYEAGYALEPRLHARLQPGGTPGALLRLFAFDDRTSIPSEEVDDWLAGRAAGN